MSGSELRDHTFGAVGLGRIARRAIELLQGFRMNPPIAFDPFVSEADAAALGVQLVSLDQLMSEADFVSVHCPLSDSTLDLIGAKEIALMKPTAFLINTARGRDHQRRRAVYRIAGEAHRGGGPSTPLSVSL